MDFGHLIFLMAGLAVYMGTLSDAYVDNVNQLQQDLLAEYNPLTIPIGPNGEAVAAVFGFSLLDIESWENDILSLDVWATVMWRDYQLQWSPADYGNISTIFLPSKLLWIPDIMLYNSADAAAGLPNGDIKMVVTSDGSVVYMPPMKLRSYCRQSNKQTRPGELNMCRLTFGSWVYNESLMNLTSQYTEIDMSDFRHVSGEWTPAASSVTRKVSKYECCPENYLTITADLTLQSIKPEQRNQTVQ